MTEIPETPTTDTPRKPDGIITTQINNHHLIIKLFFNHDSKETFQDKLLRVILAEEQSDPKKAARTTAALPMVVSK
jgi:hypothetical protein